jgi:RNA polymerase sigma factor (sigma-70 family)
MPGDRDAIDARLLACGDHEALLTHYFEVVVARCRVRARSADEAEEAQSRVFERLLAELRRGKAYSVPFRVVVNNVVDWVLGDIRRDRARLPLPDEHIDHRPDGRGEDWIEAVGHRDLFGRLHAELPDGERRVFDLRFFGGLEIAEIARRLGMNRNAVDQVLHRIRVRLRRLAGDD